MTSQKNVQQIGMCHYLSDEIIKTTYLRSTNTIRYRPGEIGFGMIVSQIIVNFWNNDITKMIIHYE